MSVETPKSNDVNLNRTGTRPSRMTQRSQDFVTLTVEGARVNTSQCERCRDFPTRICTRCGKVVPTRYIKLDSRETADPFVNRRKKAKECIEYQCDIAVHPLRVVVDQHTIEFMANGLKIFKVLRSKMDVPTDQPKEPIVDTKILSKCKRSDVTVGKRDVNRLPSPSKNPLPVGKGEKESSKPKLLECRSISRQPLSHQRSRVSMEGESWQTLHLSRETPRVRLKSIEITGSRIKIDYIPRKLAELDLQVLHQTRCQNTHPTNRISV